MAYTKRIYFKAIEEYFKNNEIVIPKTAIKGEGELQEDITSKDIVNFSIHEIELLNKKANSKAPSKTQIENENIKKVIVSILTDSDKPLTITEIQNSNNSLVELSNQKMSALLTQLINENVVVRTIEKKKAYFSICH